MNNVQRLAFKAQIFIKKSEWKMILKNNIKDIV